MAEANPSKAFKDMGKMIRSSASAPAPIGPYSQAVESAGLLFLSGQIGLRGDPPELSGPGIEEETRQVMDNLAAVLAAAGMGWDQVVRATIYLVDLKQFGTVNEIYGSYFSGNYPARETVQIAALPRGARVEISLIAAR